MTKKYKYTAKDAAKLNKHGVDLTVYGGGTPEANVVHVSVDDGHFEEFYNTHSHFIYYIIDGKGTFVLDDEPVEVEATDLVTIPPNTRIHYFGTMAMLLTVSPAFNEEHEHHVRFVDEKENPYNQQ